MAIIPKITNDNEKNFKIAEEIWTTMGKQGNFDGIYDTRRNFYQEKNGLPYTDDNHFRLTNNLSGNEKEFSMDQKHLFNKCIQIGKKGGLESFRTIQSIIWSCIHGTYYPNRKNCVDRGSENLAILLYLCGQEIITKQQVEQEIKRTSKGEICLTEE